MQNQSFVFLLLLIDYYDRGIYLQRIPTSAASHECVRWTSTAILAPLRGKICCCVNFYIRVACAGAIGTLCLCRYTCMYYYRHARNAKFFFSFPCTIPVYPVDICMFTWLENLSNDKYIIIDRLYGFLRRGFWWPFFIPLITHRMYLCLGVFSQDILIPR